MDTIQQSSRYFVPRMSWNRNQWSKSKQSHLIKSKPFRFGGNRKDPLNLNDLIQKKKQSTTNYIYGNDRPVDILLQPNIFDPLCLDISSSSDENKQIDLQQVPESNGRQPIDKY